MMNYNQLKNTGKLLFTTEDHTEIWVADGKIYTACYRSLGGYIGSAGWEVKEQEGGCDS